MMKILTAAVIFGAGYLLGRPEGRAKVAELLHRPEVAQLTQQATSTATTAARTGRQQLATTTQKMKDTATEKRSGRAADSAGDDATAATRGLRLPRMPRRGGRVDAPTVPTGGATETVTTAVAHDTPPSPQQANGDTPPHPAPSPTMPETPK